MLLPVSVKKSNCFMQKLLYGVVFGFDLFFTQEVVFDCFISTHSTEEERQQKQMQHGRHNLGLGGEKGGGVRDINDH